MSNLLNRIKEEHEKAEKENVSVNVETEKMNEFREKCKRLGLVQNRVWNAFLDQFLEMPDEEFKDES